MNTQSAALATQPAVLQPEPRASTGTFQIPSLDGIRALSFFLVFAAHGIAENIIPAHLGLTVFFFLSGYLITTLLRVEYDRTGGISVRQFYLRRVLRIFPPFYLVLASAALLTSLGLLGSELSLPALAAQCAHLTNYYIVERGWWTGMPPGTSVYWSLAVEEHFYLAFPLLFLVLRKTVRSYRGVAGVLLFVCALVLAWRCVLVIALHAPHDRTYVATDTRIDGILFGCALALWHNPVMDRAQISDRMLKRLWLPTSAAALLLCLVFGRLVTIAGAHGWLESFKAETWQATFDQTVRYTLESAALAPIFIAAVRWHDHPAVRWLSAGWLVRVGTLSYSLYLMHFTALWGFGRVLRWAWFGTADSRAPLPAWLTALGAVTVLAALLVIANTMYQYIERPCADLRRKLARYLA